MGQDYAASSSYLKCVGSGISLITWAGCMKGHDLSLKGGVVKGARSRPVGILVPSEGAQIQKTAI
jgi:hypothetical protein